MKVLNEKRAKRDHLKEQVDECNRMMAGLVKTTLDHGRKAHSNGKDLLSMKHMARLGPPERPATWRACGHVRISLLFSSRSYLRLN